MSYKIAFRLLSIITFLLIIGTPSLSKSSDVISVQTVRIPPYNEAYSGLKEKCRCSLKQIITSEMQGADIPGKIKEEKPDVIVAIGIGALNKVRGIDDIPIVYVMVLNSQARLAGKQNVAGINMFISPERQLAIIRKALPGINSIGLVYNPSLTGRTVSEMIVQADKERIIIKALPVRDKRDVPLELNKVMPQVDAFWMVPDVSVISRESTEFIMLGSLKHGVPVITFSRKYLEIGAMISLDVDAHDMGRQAAGLVMQVLGGVHIKDIAGENAEKINVTVNRRIAKKLGVKLSDDIHKWADVIHGE